MRERHSAQGEGQRWTAASGGRIVDRHEQATAVKASGRSLAVVIDVWIGLAFIVAMAVCAGVEYARNPDVALYDLLFHHIQELFLFGFVLWGISWLVLRAILVAPIQQIFRHLYGVGGGDHTTLVVKTGVREIREIVDAVNIMLWRMDQRADLNAVRHARQKLSDIREHITECEGIDHEKLSLLLELVSTLDGKLHQIAQAGAIKQETRKNNYWGFPERS